MEFYRPTFAEISLAALAHNLQQVRGRIPAGVGICAMVKADAYGHGAVPVAKRLAAAGAVAFGVATVEEGSELRTAGVTQPILVMGGLMGQGGRVASALVAEGLMPVLHTQEAVPAIEEAAVARHTTVTVHVKIDTGMSRLGARPEPFGRLLEAIRAAPHLKLGGVMTHLAFAADADYTAVQMAAFRPGAERVAAMEPEAVWHVANSAAVLRNGPIPMPQRGCAWVRPGVMLYGAAPFPEDRGRCDLHPVMTLKSQVILVKQVPPGTKVSYNCTWTAARTSRVATVPVGYADGYPWALANRGQVLIGGRRYPVVGRVTMDFLMVDVTDGPALAPGAEVVLLGRQGNMAVTAEDLAEWAGTIPYEIFCRVSKRMPRVYKDSA